MALFSCDVSPDVGGYNFTLTYIYSVVYAIFKRCVTHSNFTLENSFARVEERACGALGKQRKKIDKYAEKWLCRGGRVAFRLIAIYSLLFFSIETKNKCNERLGTEVFI